jgi:predicted GNAT family N-acyltransferase
MKIRIFAFPFSDEESRKKAFAVRQEVFVVEQGVDTALEYDDQEEASTHFLALDGEDAVAVARMRHTADGIKLERFAVPLRHRNRGLGSQMLDFVMKDIRNSPLTVYLHAQLRAVPFYERHGFACEGNVFEEAGILHYRMVFKNTDLPAEAILPHNHL